VESTPSISVQQRKALAYEPKAKLNRLKRIDAKDAVHSLIANTRYLQGTRIMIPTGRLLRLAHMNQDFSVRLICQE
jgi:hypothetical protein